MMAFGPFKKIVKEQHKKIMCVHVIISGLFD